MYLLIYLSPRKFHSKVQASWVSFLSLMILIVIIIMIHVHVTTLFILDKTFGNKTNVQFGLYSFYCIYLQFVKQVILFSSCRWGPLSNQDG